MNRPRWDAAERALLAPHPRLGVPVPDYTGRSLPNVSATIARHAGLPREASSSLAPGLRTDLDPLREAVGTGPTVLFLLDAFGWSAFRQWVEHANTPFAERWGNLAEPITTTFPSTTTAALFSLSTGTPPGRHGLVGFHLWLPRWGLVADMIKMAPVSVPGRDLIGGSQGPPSGVTDVPTLFRSGVNAVAVSRDRFEGSGFTRLLYDGAEYCPYATASDLALRLEEILTRPQPPRVVSAYWDELDTVEHLRGPRPALFEFEMDRIAGLITHVARRLPKDLRQQATLLVTGDHGQVPTDRRRQVSLEQHAEVLRELARPPGGERRALYLSARPGRLDALRQGLAGVVPEGTRVLEAPEAVDAGLFGPLPHHPELLDRIGDLIVLPPVPTGLTYHAPGAGIPGHSLAGGHGGLDPAELLVPLVAGRWSDFLER
jgi:hypothetical protein